MGDNTGFAGWESSDWMLKQVSQANYSRNTQQSLRSDGKHNVKLSQLWIIRGSQGATIILTSFVKKPVYCTYLYGCVLNMQSQHIGREVWLQNCTHKTFEANVRVPLKAKQLEVFQREYQMTFYKVSDISQGVSTQPWKCLLEYWDRFSSPQEFFKSHQKRDLSTPPLPSLLFSQKHKGQIHRKRNTVFL